MGLVGFSAVVSFGIIGAVSTSPSDDVVFATGETDAQRSDDVSRSDERDARWIGGVAVRPETGPGSPAPGPTVQPTSDPDRKPEAAAALPADSGSGKRVVFDITGQQVWLVRADDEVKRTYMVSGSRYDQLPTGSFEVTSRSRHTTSWHGTETMEYMVRFFQGEQAAIGFHDLPVAKATGEEVQTLAELGTPLSDGCIRQADDDAAALWDFADVGTTVVVVRT